MAYSFTFCGKDVTEIGLHYVPENADTYVFGIGAYTNSEQKFEGHDGGYYYGNTVQPKKFTLRCYYEKQQVEEGLFAKVHAMFRRGRSGRLVFSPRPWLYYIATVTDVNTSKLINLENGLVTITLTAYYPYAMTDYKYIPADASFAETMAINSAMPTSDILPECEFTDIEYTSTMPTILLYNGGTERASVKIGIAGDTGTGVTIYNRTTDQICGFKGLNGTNTANKYVEYDGRTGNAYWVSNDDYNGESAFLYHDYGVIELEPSYPAERGITLTTEANSPTLTSEESTFTSDMIGKYVYADGQFRRIVNVPDEHTLTVSSRCENAGTETDSMIVTMNEIIVHADTTMNLTYLAFDYKHTFA